MRNWAVAAITAIAFTSVALACALAAPACAYESITVSGGGTISGVVKYAGPAPALIRLEVSKDKDVCGAHPIYDQSLVVGANGGIANAVVTLTDIQKGEPMTPMTGVKFDQRGCEYVPHVIAFPAGSTVRIFNSDGILHSVHTESSINPPVDMAQPGFKKTITVTIAKPELIKVACDAHNWMEGWWYAAANPYYAVTGPGGRYIIQNVPPGTYTLEVWQEKLGVAKQSVTVGQGASVNANFTMNPPKS